MRNVFSCLTVNVEPTVCISSQKYVFVNASFGVNWLGIQQYHPIFSELHSGHPISQRYVCKETIMLNICSKVSFGVFWIIPALPGGNPIDQWRQHGYLEYIKIGILRHYKVWVYRILSKHKLSYSFELKTSEDNGRSKIAAAVTSK